MSLLREIQEAAIDDKIGLPTLLRKCKVLAARLGNAEFKIWVENELNGYKTEDEIPEYRIIPVFLKGHFMGAFGSGLQNANIPVSCFPTKFEKDLLYVNFTAPIASLEDLAKDEKNSTIIIPLSADFVAQYGRQIYERMNCMEAWKIVSNNLIVALLDTVRNKILQFALEIEAEDPNAGEAPINSNPVPQEKVNQIFNTYITGNVHNMANASSNFNQSVEISSEMNAELFNKLLNVIKQSGINLIVINQLTNAVEEMKENQGKVTFKTHYLNFMSLLADHMQVLGPTISLYLSERTELFYKCSTRVLRF